MTALHSFLSNLLAGPLALLGFTRVRLRFEQDCTMPQVKIKSRLYETPKGMWIVAWDGNDSVELELVGGRLIAEIR